MAFLSLHLGVPEGAHEYDNLAVTARTIMPELIMIINIQTMQHSLPSYVGASLVFLWTSRPSEREDNWPQVHAKTYTEYRHVSCKASPITYAAERFRSLVRGRRRVLLVERCIIYTS